MLLLFKKLNIFFNQELNNRNNDLQLHFSVNELAGLPETANSIFKVMEYLRAENNDFTLIGYSIYCIPVLVARLRKRHTFLFLHTQFSFKHLKQSKYKSQQRDLNPQPLNS